MSMAVLLVRSFRDLAVLFQDYEVCHLDLKKSMVFS